MIFNNNKPLEKIALEQEFNTVKIPAKCPFYEPLSHIEGDCLPSKRIVSRLGGCDDYEKCRIYISTMLMDGQQNIK